MPLNSSVKDGPSQKWTILTGINGSILLKNFVLTNEHPNFGSRQSRRFDSAQLCTLHSAERDCHGRFFSLQTSSSFRSEFFNRIGRKRPPALLPITLPNHLTRAESDQSQFTGVSPGIATMRIDFEGRD